MRIVLIAAIGLASATSTALAAKPYEGKWVSHQAHCKIGIGATAKDGSVADGTMIIKGKSLKAHESSCIIKSARNVGEAWIIKSSCESEGEIMDDVMTMKIDGDIAVIEERGTRLRCAR